MTILAYLAICAMMSVSGQILLKRGLAQLGPLELAPDTLVSTILACALNPTIVLGLAITVAGTFFWLITLSRVDLSFAYPFASLNNVFILAASWLLLGETLSPTRLLGVLAICGGVFLVARTQQRSDTAHEAPRQPAHAMIATTARPTA
jgi:drug/metabolite transporter (DMT)-like permease